MVIDNGCWADYRSPRPRTAGRPCMFLDRDGVLIEDTGYPHDPTTVRLIPETLDLVRTVQDQGFVVGIVTNQSGIGRGYFDWDAFAAVQSVIDAALQVRGARVDFVLACPHIREAPLPRYRHPQHPWRKPEPGMLLAAAAALDLACDRSAMIGDQTSDMIAAVSADVAIRGLLVPPGAETPVGNWDLIERKTLSRWFLDRVGARPTLPLVIGAIPVRDP